MVIRINRWRWLFILTKKGYASCEITMGIRDKKALYEIKQKFGGSVKTVAIGCLGS